MELGFIVHVDCKFTRFGKVIIMREPTDPLIRVYVAILKLYVVNADTPVSVAKTLLFYREPGVN